MQPGKRSYTALAAAAARAAHTRLYDAPRIFVDEYADRLIGLTDRDALRTAFEGSGTPSPARIAAFFALRHRYAEDRLLDAVQRGVRQCLLLGAGLDTLCLRRPEIVRDVHLVEADHPDTQRWKLARLASLGIETPGVTYVAIDFEREQLGDRLVASGVRLDQPLFVTWLGVVHYVDRAAVEETLRFVATRPAGSEVVFDFIVRHDLVDADERALSETVAANSTARGEPWVTYFDPRELESSLRRLGFDEVERLTPALAAAYYGGQPEGVTPFEVWQVMAARTRA